MGPSVTVLKATTSSRYWGIYNKVVSIFYVEHVCLMLYKFYIKIVFKLISFLKISS